MFFQDSVLLAGARDAILFVLAPGPAALCAVALPSGPVLQLALLVAIPYTRRHPVHHSIFSFVAHFTGGSKTLGKLNSVP